VEGVAGSRARRAGRASVEDEVHLAASFVAVATDEHVGTVFGFLVCSETVGTPHESFAREAVIVHGLFEAIVTIIVPHAGASLQGVAQVVDALVPTLTRERDRDREQPA
jgi:hypothetical protein